MLYEAPHRVARTLADLAAACGGDRRVVLARELNKLHEEHWRSTLDEAVARVAEVERQTVEGQRQMVLFLHERLQRKGLTAAQQKTALAILKSLLHQHMQMGMDVDIDDPAMMELRALYKVEEEAELQNKALCDEALDMAQDVLGDALDRETLKGFETTEEVLEALLEQVRAHEETEQERQAARRVQRERTRRSSPWRASQARPAPHVAKPRHVHRRNRRRAHHSHRHHRALHWRARGLRGRGHPRHVHRRDRDLAVVDRDLRKPRRIRRRRSR